jgi:ssRNA-specific RNase YbeY (16S rRNA maturation enzyme)
MIEVEVFGADGHAGVPSAEEVLQLCATTAQRLGVVDGHVAVEFVDAARIAQLNAEYRGKA